MTLTRDSLHLKTKLFRGLADPSRMAILEMLRDGPKNVTEIVEVTGLSQSNASMHLDCLWCCGLVNREVRGRFRYYRIASKKLFRVLLAADAILRDVAERIDQCARYEARLDRRETLERTAGLNR
jgi:DNA-binding transcriptional ArsR family regulator